MLDESHRLKQMPEGYDKQLFNQLYKETRELRKKLAFMIDSRKFGVDYYEILSWFDVKFIYAFNRYYGDPRIKGYIINSLQTYKTRIIKNSYQDKHLLNNTSDIDDMYALENVSDEAIDNTEPLVNVITSYFKARLSSEAFLLWETEIKPPPYLLNGKVGKNIRITDDDLINFFDLPQNEDSVYYLKSLRVEIRSVTKRAKEYFSDVNPL